MLQKFALAFKSKTIEFFAEGEGEDEEEEEEENAVEDLSLNLPAVDLDPAPEEVITGQRVVVLKPDPPARPDPHSLIPSLHASISSFRAAYLQLQTAHSPFDPDTIRTADRSAVSHLQRLSDLKRAHYGLLQSPTPNLLSSHLEAQVQENQSLLRSFETVVNRLQSDIDRKDAEAAALKQTLRDIDAVNSKLARRLDRVCSSPDDRVETLLSVSVFDSVLKDSCRATHHFTRILLDVMKHSGWNLYSAANSIYPDLAYAKSSHCQYAILSYIFLKMFEGFNSNDFSFKEDGIGSENIDVKHRRTNSLRQFIEHSATDPLEVLSRDPSCEFAIFCKKKYQKVIHAGMEPSLFGNSDQLESLLGSLQPSSPLYEPFVNMASSVWTLHKLALAYKTVVEIFQVERGKEFHMVYMESVVRSTASVSPDQERQQKVGFTVVPGFRVGKTVIQCRVYLDCL